MVIFAVIIISYYLVILGIIQAPQHESKDKKIKGFTSGTIAMDVNLEKSGFFQGERL